MSNDSISTKSHTPLSLKGALECGLLTRSLTAESMNLAAIRHGEAGRASGFFEEVWQAIVRVLDLTNLTAAETAIKGMANAPSDPEKLGHYLALREVTAEKDHLRFTCQRQGNSVVLRVTGTPLELTLDLMRLGFWEGRLTELAIYEAPGAPHV